MIALGTVLLVLKLWFLLQDDQLILFYVRFIFRHQTAKSKYIREASFSAFLMKVFDIFFTYS
jgi:hypothetical protein